MPCPSSFVIVLWLGLMAWPKVTFAGPHHTCEFFGKDRTFICSTNAPIGLNGLSLSFKLNAADFTAGDLLVVSCAVSNRSSSVIHISAVSFDAWTFNFLNAMAFGEDCAFRRINHPKPKLPSGDLHAGEVLYAEEKYCVPDYITIASWHTNELQLATYRDDFIKKNKNIDVDELTLAAYTAYPTNTPAAFSFDTMAAVVVAEGTNKVFFIVQPKWEGIPVREQTRIRNVLE